MKKFISEKEYKRSKRFNCILTILFLVLFILVILQVLFANQLVEKGEEIKILSSKIDRIKKENQKIKELIANETSLDKVLSKAKEMGMVKLTSVIHLSAPSTIAFSR